MTEYYHSESPALAEIIERLGGGLDGATYLIPDLQRGFVWKPQKMEALLDTLFKGWPFGSVLLADVGSRALAFSPRCFYGTVYCGDKNHTSGDSQNIQLCRADSAVRSYKLVLDGQQRLQSLLICFGAASLVKGVVMLESDWLMYNGNRRKRKPKSIYPPCYMAVNLRNLSQQIKAFGADFSKLQLKSTGASPILTWVASDYTDNAWNWHWENELPWMKDDIEKDGSVVVRLSDMWRFASRDDAGVGEIVSQYGITDMGDVESVSFFMRRIKELRNLPVNCMCLNAPDDDDLGSRYNEMVLNVFTRLNAAGVELDKEDITLSWLKRYWVKGRDGNSSRDAKTAIVKLQERLRNEFGIDLPVNDVVTALSVVWACFENKGVAIDNNDLLDGETLKKVAAWLSGHWNMVAESICSVAAAFKSRGLMYGAQYGSLRVISLVTSWELAGRIWYLNNATGANVNIAAGFNDLFVGKLDERLDRLLFAGQWSGGWHNQARMRSLSEMIEDIKSAKEIVDAKRILLGYLDDQISVMSKGAIQSIRNLGIASRNGVSAYKSFLWVWQRLTPDRAKYSTILARQQQGRGEGLPHVDHCLSSNCWHAHLLPKFKVEEWTREYADVSEKVNQIGNCNIIMGALNISKSDKEGSELRTFLEAVVGAGEVDKCLSALQIDPLLVDPDAAENIKQLLDVMDARTKMIKNDLERFLTDNAVVRCVDPNV